MYKNIVDAFGVEITKTKFLNDINKAVDDYNKICVLFNLKEMRTGYHQVEDEKQDERHEAYGKFLIPSCSTIKTCIPIPSLTAIALNPRPNQSEESQQLIFR